MEDASHLIGYPNIFDTIADANLGGEYCSSIHSALARRSIPPQWWHLVGKPQQRQTLRHAGLPSLTAD
jgi:hypothetical protein